MWNHGLVMKRKTIDSSNIEAQSYYNLVQLCEITGFANPLRAILGSDFSVEVLVDEIGNIRSKAE